MKTQVKSEVSLRATMQTGQMVYTFNSWRDCAEYCRVNAISQGAMKWDRATGQFWIDPNHIEPSELQRCKQILSRYGICSECGMRMEDHTIGHLGGMDCPYADEREFVILPL